MAKRCSDTILQKWQRRKGKKKMLSSFFSKNTIKNIYICTPSWTIYYRGINGLNIPYIQTTCMSGKRHNRIINNNKLTNDLVEKVTDEKKQFDNDMENPYEHKMMWRILIIFFP